MPGLADLMFQSNGTINPQYTAFRDAKQQQQSARNATRGQYDALLANFMQNFGGKRGDAKNAFQAQYGKFSDGTNNFLSRAPGYMNAFNNAQGLKSGLMSLLPQQAQSAPPFSGYGPALTPQVHPGPLMPPSAPMQANPGSLAMGMTPGPMSVGGRQFTAPTPSFAVGTPPSTPGGPSYAMPNFTAAPLPGTAVNRAPYPQPMSNQTFPSSAPVDPNSLVSYLPKGIY